MVDPIVTIAAGMSVQSPSVRMTNRNADVIKVDKESKGVVVCTEGRI